VESVLPAICASIANKEGVGYGHVFDALHDNVMTETQPPTVWMIAAPQRGCHTTVKSSR
jgi:hypothetical protein